LIAVFFVLYGNFPSAAPEEQRTWTRLWQKGEYWQRCRVPQPVSTEPFQIVLCTGQSPPVRGIL